MKGKCITDGVYEEVNNAFERALVFMHKVSGVTMPLRGHWCSCTRLVVLQYL